MEAKKKKWELGIVKEKEGSLKFDNPAPISPVHPMILIEEPTYEGLVKYLSIGQPSVGLFSDEGERFLTSYAMSKESNGKTIAGLSNLWDGKAITRMRSLDGSTLLFGKRASMHLMIQEVFLPKLMSDKILAGQGFLSRCLISFPTSTAGTRAYVEENLNQDPSMQRYWARIDFLLRRKMPVGSPPHHMELNPPCLELNREAKEIWIKYHNDIEAQLGEGKRLAPIRDLGSKAAEHVTRLASTLATTENPDATEIKAQFVENAIKLMEFYLYERLRLAGYLSVPESLKLALKALEWTWQWLDKKETDLLHLSALNQYGPNEIRTATKARQTMKILEDHSWAIPCPNTEVEGKRHKEVWRILKSED